MVVPRHATFDVHGPFQLPPLERWPGLENLDDVIWSSSDDLGALAPKRGCYAFGTIL